MPVPTFVAQSLTELIAARAASQPDSPAVHTGAAPFGDQLQTLTYAQIQRAVDRLAAHYASLQPDLDPQSVNEPPERVIAVLVSTAIDESLLEIALAKLGLTPLLLSVNNSAAAVAHLVEQTRSTHLLYGPKFEETAKEAQSLLASRGYTVPLIKEHRYPLWGKGGVDDAAIARWPARLTPSQERSRTCVILHSSGSTGFPKPVYVTHYGLIANIAQALAKSGFSALPLFHGFGHFSIFRCFYYAKPFTLFPPHLPLTSRNICRVIASSPDPPEQHFAVPYVLKLLAETEEGTRALAAFDAVSFAGAAVPDDLGDRLVAAGVKLISIYGTTETGSLLNSRRDYASDKGWNWLRREGPIVEYSTMEDRGAGTYELVVKDGWPPKILSNRPDNSYATKDLFLQHPSSPSWYKYIGRLDDTLTQTLGEKTNPVPIELAIRGNSPLVQECIVFGDGRPQVGCLLLPSDAAGDLWRDRKAYLDAVWPVVEAANAIAPSHSRILPEMIDILPAGTHVPVATKMSILRPACYKAFAERIQAVYERFEGGDDSKRRVESLDEMETIVEEAIRATIGPARSSSLTRDTDLFAHGVDSLQATRIRNTIVKRVELQGSLGQNVVYEYPSISKLAKHVLDVCRGDSAAARDESAAAHQAMLDMVDRWAQQIEPVAAAARRRHEPAVVVLTGATGSLGAHILARLAASPDVAEIVCLSRASSHDESLARVRESLARRQLPASALDKVTSLASDVNRADLGLTRDELAALQLRASHVIHNAWPVNFVLGFESYEPHIGGAVHLLNLARRNGAHFYFSSSVATRQGRQEPGGVVDERVGDSPATAAGTGYGRSKWVVEKLCERAVTTSQQTGAVGILRIGQLVGDTTRGVWNETEAWPLMFRAANTTGALPMLDERVSWLPVDLAARAIVEVLHSTAASAGLSVYHIVNPNTTAPWSTILGGLSRGGLAFTPVDRREWVDRLAASDDDPARNPSRKLLAFFRARIGGERWREPATFETHETHEVAPTIAGAPAISEELVARWVAHWKETGFLH